MSAFEQSVRDFVTAHNLVTMSISYSQYDDHGYAWFGASAQWLDPNGAHGRGIATGDGSNIADAMANMMTVMASKRGSMIDTSEALEVAA